MLTVITLKGGGFVEIQDEIDDADVTRAHLLTSIPHLVHLLENEHSFLERFGYLFSEEERLVIESIFLAESRKFAKIYENYQLVVSVNVSPTAIEFRVVGLDDKNELFVTSSSVLNQLCLLIQEEQVSFGNDVYSDIKDKYVQYVTRIQRVLMTALL